MNRPLTLACTPYDRTAALADGRVRPQGIDLTYLGLPVEETFYRMARYREFDVAEMSLSSYTISLSHGLTGDGAPFVAIPVFPSRAFRHHAVYVHAGSGIERPEDLAGRVVGVPEYQITAAVWIRGILAEHHGVPVASVRYRTGGLHEPGRVEKIAIDVPGVEIEPVPAGRTLDDLLAAGELDAVYTARAPRSYLDGNPAVRRLWDDPRAAETAYFTATGIFPIMHTVAIRREVYERDRWIARSLLDAFEQAKALAAAELEETASFANMLPWGYEQAREVRAVMGRDYWPYQLAPNEAALRTLLGYLHDQGLTPKPWRPSELFAAETQTTTLV